jgi:hypothetical protein
MESAKGPHLRQPEGILKGVGNTGLSESTRRNPVIAECGEQEFTETWFTLYDIGGDALVNGITFDEHRTEPWKLGWIDVDIKFGTIGGRKR